MIKIAICDDERESQLQIQRQVLAIAEKFHETPETYLYTSGETLVKVLTSGEETMDILFLDIDMPDISGLAVAKAIREKELSVLLIFVSAHEQYVFASIEYQPFRYIRKSVMDKELEPALMAAIANIRLQNQTRVQIKTEEAQVWIAPGDILYYETVGRKVDIYMKNGQKYTVNKHLKEVRAQINDDRDFLQIHSGCMVNLRYITAFSNFDITVADDTHLIISRRRVKDVKEALLVYWGNRI